PADFGKLTQGICRGSAWRDAKLTNWARRVIKKTSRLTKTASGRSRTKVAKAASISRLVLALSTWICSPMTRAAAAASLNTVSVIALAGFEHGDTSGSGHHFTQEFQPLCGQLTS